MHWIVTLALAAAILFLLYRRGRRLFVRQRFSVARLIFRLALFGTITSLLLVVVGVLRGPAPLAGLAIGAALGVAGATLTRFESVDGVLGFTPNRYLGLAVLSLVLGRMLYRLGTVFALAPDGAGTPAPYSPAESLRSSPTMAGAVFLLLGYYLAYSVAVLLRGARISATA